MINIKQRKFMYQLGNMFCVTVNEKPHSIYIPSRVEILKQLGISKEQDDAMQAKYSIEHVKPTDL